MGWSVLNYRLKFLLQICEFPHTRQGVKDARKKQQKVALAPREGETQREAQKSERHIHTQNSRGDGKNE